MNKVRPIIAILKRGYDDSALTRLRTHSWFVGEQPGTMLFKPTGMVPDSVARESLHAHAVQATSSPVRA